MLLSPALGYFMVISQFVPTRPIICYSCSSLVESGCVNLFRLFTTYHELNYRMKKNCSEFNSTGCGTYLWVLKEPEVGTTAVGSSSTYHVAYIQRGCADLPQQQYCDAIKKRVIDVLNVTSYNQHKHCKVCNESYCNSVSLERFYNSGNGNRVGMFVLWCILVAGTQVDNI